MPNAENDVNRCRECGTPVRDNYDLCDTHDRDGTRVLPPAKGEQP